MVAPKTPSSRLARREAEVRVRDARAVDEDRDGVARHGHDDMRPVVRHLVERLPPAPHSVSAARLCQ